jgi:uncharacterized protein YbaP (TraB family)
MIPARLICALWLCFSLTVPPAAADEDYQGRSGRKALAAVPGFPDSRAIAHSQPNDLQAAIQAVQACNRQRQPEQPPCELLILNDEPVTTSTEIRARAELRARDAREGKPRGPHTEAATQPLALWRYSGPAATVYLAGSVHVLKAGLYPLPDPYEQAFQAADHLVMEVDIAGSDPRELQHKLRTYGTLPGGLDIEQVLTEPLLSRLKSALADHGVPLNALIEGKPALIMNQLLALRLAALGYHARFGMEQHFSGRAEDRRILTLETIDEQFELLFNQPLDLQQALLADLLDQLPEMDTIISEMLIAWLSGDDEAFLELFTLQSGDSEAVRRFSEALLEARNARMAPRIRDFLNGEGTYFVLVGAAHLIGPGGIPALLAAEGLQSTRLASDSIIH